MSSAGDSLAKTVVTMMMICFANNTVIAEAYVLRL